MPEPKKILCVEDSPSTVRLVGRAVENFGGTFVTVDSAAQARSLITERFDLMFCDTMLVDENGTDVVRMYRKAWPELPILVLSGVTTSGYAESYQVAGASSFFLKPLDVARLESLLRQFLAT